MIQANQGSKLWAITTASHATLIYLSGIFVPFQTCSLESQFHKRKFACLFLVPRIWLKNRLCSISFWRTGHSRRHFFHWQHPTGSWMFPGFPFSHQSSHAFPCTPANLEVQTNKNITVWAHDLTLRIQNQHIIRGDVSKFYVHYLFLVGSNACPICVLEWCAHNLSYFTFLC